MLDPHGGTDSVKDLQDDEDLCSKLTFLLGHNTQTYFPYNLHSEIAETVLVNKIKRKRYFEILNPVTANFTIKHDIFSHTNGRN